MKPYEQSNLKSSHEESIREPSESSTESTSTVVAETALKPETEIEASAVEAADENFKQKAAEPIYAVPHKHNSLIQQRSTPSTDSATSQVTVIPQKSVDSDIMYNNAPSVITNSVLAELESQESYERHCKEAFCREKNVDEADSEVELRNDGDKSEPFLMTRESLQSSNKVTSPAVRQKSEANILDLNDVEYADASDSEQDNNRLGNKVPEADAMTPAEAENLLSSK